MLSLFDSSKISNASIRKFGGLILTGKGEMYAWDFGGAIIAPFASGIVASIRAADTDDTYVKRVSQRSAKSRGFSPGTPVSSHKEC